MKKIALFIALALVLIPLNSCKKDDDPTKTELLTDGIWIGVNQKNYAEGILENTYLIPELRVNYKSDFTGISYIGNEIDNTFNWSFNEDETKLIFDEGILNIEVLTNATFVLSSEDIQEGINYKTVLTFKH